MKKIAFYGGSFDPLHLGHLKIAETLIEVFRLDEFVFIPAFHAPHKKDRKPLSAFHRFAMICLATQNLDKTKVSTIELDLPEKPYTVETLAKLKDKFRETEIFFVMGADSWQDITTWREWEKVLTMVNIIVVTRPDYEITFSHVTEEIRSKIIDLRFNKTNTFETKETSIYITDKVQIDISSTEIRRQISEKTTDWTDFVSSEVAKYIEKYDIY